MKKKYVLIPIKSIISLGAGGRDQEDHVSMPAHDNSLQNSISKLPKKNRTSRMA
jgi:hypothetical protein